MAKKIAELARENKSPITYSDLELISEIGSEVLSTLKLDELIQKSLETIVHKCELLGGVLFLVEEDYIYAKTVAGDKAASRFLKLIAQPISSLKIKMNASSENAVVKSLIEQNVYFSHDLEEFTKHVLSSKVSKAAAVVTGTKTCIALPIIHKGETIGGLFFAKSEKADFAKELPILTLLSNHLGIAITNAKLYEQLDQLNKDLLTSNDELQGALATVNELRRQERDMIDVMGHELKTPITTVLAILQIMEKTKLKKGTIEPEQLDKYIQLALSSTKKEVALIETLLSATKVEAKRIHLDKYPIDLLEVIDSTIANYREISTRKKVEIRYKRPANDVFINTDKIRLQEIIDNLLSNALKYTPEGFVEIKIVQHSKTVEVSVKDSGVGISESELKHLGKKFFRAKESLAEAEKNGFSSPTGTGLGLYVVQGLLKEMGGNLKIESVLGKGTTFSFTLPIK